MKRPGFTLIEMTISLMIISLIMIITVPKATTAYDEWKTRKFWNSLRQEWQLSQVRAQVQQVPTEIYYQSKNRRLVFYSELQNHYVSLPDNIICYNVNEIKMHSNGYVKPTTWGFIDKQKKEEIKMKIQMGGGGYRLEKKRIHP